MYKRLVYLFTLIVFVIPSCTDKWDDTDYFLDYLTRNVWSEFIYESFDYSEEQTLEFYRGGTGKETFYYYDHYYNTYEREDYSFRWERISETSRNLLIRYDDTDEEFTFRITSLNEDILTGYWYDEESVYFMPR